MFSMCRRWQVSRLLDAQIERLRFPAILYLEHDQIITSTLVLGWLLRHRLRGLTRRRYGRYRSSDKGRNKLGNRQLVAGRPHRRLHVVEVVLADDGDLVRVVVEDRRDGGCQAAGWGVLGLRLGTCGFHHRQLNHVEHKVFDGQWGCVLSRVLPVAVHHGYRGRTLVVVRGLTFICGFRRRRVIILLLKLDKNRYRP